MSLFARLGSCALALAASLAAAPLGAQTLTYLPGNVINVNGCNSKTGAVAVGGHFAGLPIHAYRWSATGGLENIGFSPLSPTYALFTEPEIGNAVCGYGSTATGVHAFYWDEQTPIRDLGTFGGTNSTAYCMSAFGEITVGEAEDSLGQFRAFRSVRGGPIEDLGTLGGFTASAYYVSQNGFTIVGTTTLKNGESRAFAWNELDGMIDLGAFDGNQSFCTRCSEDGTTVLGRSRKKDGKYYPFRWTTKGMVDLGSLGGASGESRYCTPTGDVVTGVAENTLGQEHAFRWSEADGFVDLKTLGGAYSFPTGIAGEGRLVVGTSENTAGEATAFVYDDYGKIRTLESVLATVMDPADLEGVHFVEPRALSRSGRVLYVDVIVDDFFPAIVQLDMLPARRIIDERSNGFVASYLAGVSFQYAYSAYYANPNSALAYYSFAYAYLGYASDYQASVQLYDWWEKEEAQAYYDVWRNAMQLYYYYAATYAYFDYVYVTGSEASYYAYAYAYYAHLYGATDLTE